MTLYTVVAMLATANAVIGCFQIFSILKLRSAKKELDAIMECLREEEGLLNRKIAFKVDWGKK